MIKYKVVVFKEQVPIRSKIVTGAYFHIFRM